MVVIASEHLFHGSLRAAFNNPTPATPKLTHTQPTHLGGLHRVQRLPQLLACRIKVDRALLTVAQVVSQPLCPLLEALNLTLVVV